MEICIALSAVCRQRGQIVLSKSFTTRPVVDLPALDYLHMTHPSQDHAISMHAVRWHKFVYKFRIGQNGAVSSRLHTMHVSLGIVTRYMWLSTYYKTLVLPSNSRIVSITA